MADGTVENPVVDIVGSAAISGLARAINGTYNYANNSLFGAMIPNFYRDYYMRNIKIAAGWLDGYVYNLHCNSGIISTRIASALINGLTKQVVGEQLVFRKASKEGDYKTLNMVSSWAKDVNLKKAVFAGIGFALGMGTSLIKVNRRVDGELWCEACRFDNCFYLAGFSNEVQEATFYIHSYTDTRQGKETDQFILVEKRFYETEETGKIALTEEGYVPTKVRGQKTAMVEYDVHRSRGTAYNNIQTSESDRSLKWSEIPENVRKMIRREYGAIRIGEPMKLGLPNLGVFVLTNGEMDLSIPTGTNFGKGMIIDVQDDLITYEVASSYLLRDMYLGKGTVYMPKDLNITDANQLPEGVMQNIGENKIEILKGVSPDQQRILVEQFSLRAQEWQLIKENSLKNIAVKWGMSPKILASFLAQGQAQQTATQIDSEDDMSIAFITHTRSYFKHALNQLIETVLNYKGEMANVELDFSSPSLVNKDRILDRVIKKIENGFIDVEEALHELNPDMDEEALQAKIDKAKRDREYLMLQNQTEMNPEGGFGNDYMDLGGDNLAGSTIPQQ